MNIYMISYDLSAPTNNRIAVEDAIKSLGIWCKYVSTTFIVKTSRDISTVSNIVTEYLDNNDKMIICKVQKPIFGWLSKDKWDWINTNI